MHVLGIDTSRPTAAVVVARRNKILATVAQGNGVSSSVTILSLIANALSKSSLTIDKINFIAISIGPGSFTGLRVGFGTALGLGHARGLKVMGVGSLDILARSQAGWDGGYIVPVEKSRKGEIYAALYVKENGKIKKVVSEMAIAPDKLAGMIDRPARFVGNGFLSYENILRAEIKSEIEFVDVSQELLAMELARIAMEKAEAEGVGEGIAAPIYISRSQAEINWERGNN